VFGGRLFHTVGISDDQHQPRGRTKNSLTI